jgi:hypothetical protein
MAKEKEKKGSSGKRRRFTWDTAAKLAAFLTGAAAGVGARTAACAGIEAATGKPLGAVADIGVGGTAGALVPAITAASPRLRKLTPLSSIGGLIGGAAPGVVRMVRDRLAAPAARGAGNAGRNVEARYLPQGSGNVGQAVAERFRLRVS